MHIKHLISAAAIALVAGLGAASAGENFGTLDGISAFDSLAGIQAVPLDTDELATITAAHFVKWNLNTLTGAVITKGHYAHMTHDDEHGVKFVGGAGGVVLSTDSDWGDPVGGGLSAAAIHGP